ncbi:uncharacterized membrane protein YgaE (UPF0421/DUF939 family) [Sediminihabitans luteus]|uniref:Uncharacterized membrane protein YgaE (UPF0421/DUF939 family) n=1 Tax=Sediminihabitans luteus TaxID=1138585 RepID=A0A2M9CED8_9CELL|nr:FUSC family protein [Sediminihabitans luteus]PJJ70294.1 uncharacterized membrane protein YgaE (UPF0421/DUF939 family) [Sediminihabitans luteus]GII97766.1 FUSC family protein [Sediminihabitans luteus]
MGPDAERRSRRLVVRARVRQGTSRVKAAFWPVLQASLAAVLAYLVGHFVLGHEYPFFAPVAAWVCLGFTADRQLRKVAELGVGVALGVLLGDLVVHWIGSGWWQVGIVLATAVLIARFIDRGVMLATQAGVQSLVIVGLPPGGTTGPLDRWTDALVGGAVALLVAVLTPGDPRRRPRSAGGDALTEVGRTLERLATGLRSGDPDDLASALVRGRASEPALEEWRAAATSAHDLSRVNAVTRRYRFELRSLERAATLAERAMRSIRVTARRAAAIPPGEHDLAPVADLVERLATATHVLAEAIAAGVDPVVARSMLGEIARDTDPHVVGAGDWPVQSLVMILRSPVVDLLETAGATSDDARAALPQL